MPEGKKFSTSRMVRPLLTTFSGKIASTNMSKTKGIDSKFIPPGSLNIKRHRRCHFLRMSLRQLKCFIDRMHKWRPKMYSFVYVLMRLTSLALERHFYCILSMQTRLVRLIST